MSYGKVEFPITCVKDGDAPAGWYVRNFQDMNGAKVKQYLSSGFEVGVYKKPEALRRYRHNTVRFPMAFIDTLTPKTHAMEIIVPDGAEVLKPLAGRVAKCHNADNHQARFFPPNDCYCFIIRY